MPGTAFRFMHRIRCKSWEVLNLCKLVIYGGTPLKGQLGVQGSKNSVLPILAASLLTEEPCEIKNCPDLADVKAAFEILENLGCRVSYAGTTALVDSSDACKADIPNELMRKMRSSVMFLGAILGRFKRASISYPGGCELGARPIDIHLRSLSRLGTRLTESGGYINCSIEKYIPQNITLMFPSVGATENIMLFCATMPGETLLRNPAREPEIVDLQNFLNCMGAKITGAGTDLIRICGVKKLHGCSYSVIPDRIAAATYACAAVSSGGQITLTKIIPEHLQIFLAVLRDMGVDVFESKNEISIRAQKRPLAVPLIKTLPYPGFPTDIQPILMGVLIKGNGCSVFNETIFENRLKHTGEFMRMGADIQVEGMNAIIHGVDRLHGAEVQAADLRGGAGLLVAGLGARGKTTISNVHHIKRGYADIVGDFRKLGAKIELKE